MAGQQWRLDPLAELHWRQLDGEWLVFESGSGDTHHFDLISAAVLICLEAKALDLGGLCEVLAGELQLSNDEDLSARIEALLEQLLKLGLIERVAP
jgi:PqqD family protein of HPr-rel-A system